MWIRVDGGLISKIVVSSSDCRDFAHRESHIPLAWLSVHSYAECNVLDQCAFPHAIIPKIWTKDFFFKVVWMHQPFLATTVGTCRIWRCFWSPWSIAQSVVGRLGGVYLPRQLWWQGTHCNYHSSRQFYIWWIQWRIMERSCWVHVPEQSGLVFLFVNNEER